MGLINRSPAIQPSRNPLAGSSSSLLMRDIYDKALRLSELDNCIIIIGEIDSGKKTLAQFIHRHSKRKEWPFHVFYCIDIDESEYKDAFWEHIQIENSHIVLTYDAIEKAASGFLYLDQFSEIKEQFMLDIISAYQQGCKQLYRYNQTLIPRLVISINHESYQKITNSRIWGRLLELLNPNTIMLPPLRERREDIPDMIQYFLAAIRRTSEEMKDVNISDSANEACYNYNWPGNILQLKNALMHGALVSNGGIIEVHHLPFSSNWSLPYKIGKD